MEKERKEKKEDIKEEKRERRKEKIKKYSKWGLWIFIALIIYVLWAKLNIVDWILSFLQKSDTLWMIYKIFETEVESKSLLGLFYISFFGSLFFISLPLEVIFLFYLGLNYTVFQIMTVIIIGELIGTVINYFIGLFVGEKAMEWLLKKQYSDFKFKINRAGAFILLVGNIIPFPIDIFVLVLGTVKYNFRRLIIYTILGKLIKLTLLYLGYVYFVKFLSPYLSDVSLSWFIDIVRRAFFGG